ncbi:hypothetical protein [Macrococcoides caseolyticum]|uniref:hypothetical protein n=1 Tax=Macrococcoides caseolyticum TaxID=69966 RepID=UPI0005A1F240|nr:hypothetical protein [Macrococcus caseolyticus]PKF29207.1 hypothetical protein CW697_09525 [Macrococcus caseolyticus]
MARTRIKIFGSYYEDDLDRKFEINMNNWLRSNTYEFVVKDIKFVPVDYKSVKVIVIFES